jgi:hypothetical protein
MTTLIMGTFRPNISRRFTAMASPCSQCSELLGIAPITERHWLQKRVASQAFCRESGHALPHLAKLLCILSSIRTRSVHKCDDGEAKMVRMLHEAKRFAVAIWLRHAKIPVDVLLRARKGSTSLTGCPFSVDAPSKCSPERDTALMHLALDSLAMCLAGRSSDQT